MRPLIGITMGDPTGVGPEILVRFEQEIKAFSKAKVIIFGDQAYLQKLHQKIFGQKRGGFSLPVVDLGLLRNRAVVFGKPTVWGGKASGYFIGAAARAAMSGEIQAMVTLPINKKAFSLGGWGKYFPDHTQMLAALSKSPLTILMMADGKFRVSHVTQHIPLKSVAAHITPSSVTQAILLTAKSLRDFGIARPRIGVCGLNPHAGDNGVLGSEEERIIAPAVKRLKKKGWRLEGPVSADILWPRLRAGEFDAVVAMYHDQGQIPFKLLSYKSAKDKLDPGGVNVTLGLPFIRTSVSHGTAYDIAGKGKISARSFFEALNLAAQMAKKI